LEPNPIHFPGLISCSLIFFVGNLLCQFISKQKANIPIDYFQALIAAFAGIVLGFGFNLIREIDLISDIGLYTGLILSGITTLSLLSGLLNYLISSDASRFKNSLFILTGLFSFDTNENSISNILRLLSRFTWELPQTIAGYIFAQTMNCIGRVGDVRLINGVTFCIHFQQSNRRQGVSIGNFIYVSLLHKENEFQKDPLLLHEYGHHLQSRRFGLFYLFIIGIPSLISALNAKSLPGGVTTHDLQWYEMQANRYAAAYLLKNYQADWTPFEPPFNSFPRSKSRNIT
jgi:hypothetical protein